MPSARFLARRGALVALLALSPLSSVAEAQTPAEPRRVTALSGSGEAEVAPDMAEVTIGATHQARTAREAMAETSRIVRDILTSLKEAGIAERDMATTGLSLQPVFTYASGRPPRLSAYSSANRVRVRVRDLTKLADVLDRAGANEANQIHGLALIVSNAPAKLDEARKSAVAEARRRAEMLAAAAGARVGRVLTITEAGGDQAPRPMASPAIAARASAAESVPVATGDQIFRVTVNVTFEIVD